MKNLISNLSILLIVLIGFTSMAQKPEWVNLKEKLSNRKNQHFNEWKTKSLESALQTKGMVSKPGYSEDFHWDETYWEHSTNTVYSYNTNGTPAEELITNATSGENSNKHTWAYDSHDNQTETIYYNWNGTNWEISWGYKDQFTYDASGSTTEIINQHWEFGNWVNYLKYIYEYDNNGFENNEISQHWENGGWVNNSKKEYTVGNQGEWLEFTEYYWENNAWANDNRFIDIVWASWDKDQVQSFLEQNWNGEWVDYKRYNATFTGDDYIGIYEEYENNTWIQYYRITYTQTPTEHIFLYEYHESKGWVNSFRNTSFYDDHGSNSGYRHESWENEVWVIDWEYNYTYTYNENNDITEEVQMYWNQETQTLENSERYIYSNFQYFESGVNDIISLSNVKVFPNPVGDILNIDIQNDNLTEAVVQIMNMTGQKVYEGVLSGQFTSININYLSKGVYIMHIQTIDNRILNYKILKD